MQNWKRLLTISALALIAAIGILAALGISLTEFIVDFWWFSSLDYGGYFWLRTLYRYIFSGGVTVFFFLIFFLNFWAASKYLYAEQNNFSSIHQREHNQQNKALLALFQSGSLKVYTPLSFFLAIMIAMPFYQQWEAALLFFFSPDSGFNDPVYHQDISFYLFRLPIFEWVQIEMLVAFSVLTLTITLLYWLEHQMLPSGNKHWPIGAKIHLNALVFVTMLIMVWGFVLDRHDLLYSAAHEPIFFGPGFVEMRYVLPLIWFSVAALIATTLGIMAYLQTGKHLKATLAFLTLFFTAWGLRHSSILPEMLDRFVIKPNPVKVEREYMDNNIKATLSAYDLDQVKTIEITAATGADTINPAIRKVLHNIPIWDPEYLDDVYQQLQGIRTYYNFTDVDVARYTINGQTEQVNLAAREINIEKLPKAAQNWENKHLRYTHGFGAVITPASQTADEPMKWFLRDLNMQSNEGFTIEKPDIYFGQEKLDYAVVPNRLNIVDISSFDMDSSQNYTGIGGVAISSLFRRLLLSIYFRDEKLFFSMNIDNKSRIMFRRNIVERIKTLTPYLSLDHDPYIVATPKRLYWIQDAYTLSKNYPVSKKSSFQFSKDIQDKSFNYIRNSVKIVVDAFDGTVDYYVVDKTDPIIMGYQKAYPGLFKDISEMPPLLKEQLRSPKDIFSIQMAIYAKYHQTDPSLFYQQAETWSFAKIKDKVVQPYYFTTELKGAEEMQEFILLNPMTPIERNNLSMLGVAGLLHTEESKSSYEEGIVVYKFSRDVQVNGPSQVSALIDQDPDIARLFTLWDQRGSQVQRGRIIILPFNRSLLYVQPVYIVSTTETKIPELARVILSMGNVVVMDTSLEKALDRLELKLRETKFSNANLETIH